MGVGALFLEWAGFFPRVSFGGLKVFLPSGLRQLPEGAAWPRPFSHL